MSADLEYATTADVLAAQSIVRASKRLREPVPDDIAALATLDPWDLPEPESVPSEGAPSASFVEALSMVNQALAAQGQLTAEHLTKVQRAVAAVAGETAARVNERAGAVRDELQRSRIQLAEVLLADALTTSAASVDQVRYHVGVLYEDADVEASAVWEAPGTP